MMYRVTQLVRRVDMRMNTGRTSVLFGGKQKRVGKDPEGVQRTSLTEGRSGIMIR